MFFSVCQQSIAIMIIDSEARLLYLLAVWGQASYLASQFPYL